MTVIIGLMAVAAPLILVWLFVVTIPELAHTRYRHDLWRIRDAIVDDILDGHLTLNPATQRVLRAIYAGIAQARSLTLRHALIAYVTVPGMSSLESIEAVLGSDALPAGERARLADYITRYHDVSSRHVWAGSPSGWIGRVVLPLIASRRRATKVVDGAVNVEIVRSALRDRDHLGTSRNLLLAG